MKVTKSKRRYVAAAIVALLSVVVFIQYPGVLYSSLTELPRPLSFLAPIFVGVTLLCLIIEFTGEKRVLRMVVKLVLALLILAVLVYTTELLAGGEIEYMLFEQPLTICITYGVLLLLLFLGYAFTGSLPWGLRIVTVISFLFGLTNYFVMKYRGAPLLPEDLVAGETALDVLGNYRWELAQPLVEATFLSTCAFILAGKTKLPSITRSYRYAIQGMLFLTVIAISYGVVDKGFFYFVELNPYYFDQASEVKNRGGLLTFVSNAPDLVNQAPDGYSVERVNNITEQYTSDSTAEADIKPDVIVIMGESWGDVAPEKVVTTNKEVMPFVDSMKENDNGIYRDLMVSGYGGGTALSEYQVLTGTSAAYGVHSAAFQLDMHENIPNLVESFQELGYETTAMHTGTSTAWERDEAFPLLGFDTFLSEEDLETNGQERVRAYLSDSVIYDKMLSILDKSEEPQFLYGITIQTHGGYSIEDYKSEIEIEAPAGDYPQAEQYLGLLHESDQDLGEFIKALEERERPTIVLAYGDHWPKVEEEYIQYVEDAWVENNSADGYIENKKMGGYETFFVMWANYDLPESVKEMPERVSLNYLSSYLMQGAELPLTGYQKFLLDGAEELPVTSMAGYIDGSGTIISSQEGKEKRTYLDQNILQYNLIWDSGNYPEDFFYLGEE